MPGRPYVSVQELLEDLGGDEELLWNILCDFYEEYGHLREVLRGGLEEKTQEGLSLASRVAHSMKSGLGTLGWEEGVLMADGIHRLCDAGEREEARKVFEAFDPPLTEMLEQVRREAADLAKILGKNS